MDARAEAQRNLSGERADTTSGGRSGCVPATRAARRAEAAGEVWKP
jgi:hypothetical protein